MTIKTNYEPLKELCDKMGAQVDFIKNDDAPVLIIEGTLLDNLIDFSKSIKGKMIFNLLGK
jgi:hypothetical protein